MKLRHIITAGLVAAASVGLVLSSHGPAHVGPAYLYPDPALTPGLVATQDITLLTATNPTYSQSHRNTTEAQKNTVRKEYSKVSCPNSSDCEADHFCPLAIGCADDVKNLWLQPATNLWDGVNYGYHEKDALEAYLARAIKGKIMTPKDAQNCILSDWVACYQGFIANKQSFGGIAPVDNRDPDDEE